MTPIQTPPGMSESAVDMSPDAIMSRLEMIGQLNDLCHFLAAGTILPRDENIEPPDQPTSSATTAIQTPHSERRPCEVQSSTESIIAERIK
jgi:hypothetical protein